MIITQLFLFALFFAVGVTLMRLGTWLYTFRHWPVQRRPKLWLFENGKKVRFLWKLLLVWPFRRGSGWIADRLSAARTKDPTTWNALTDESVTKASKSMTDVQYTTAVEYHWKCNDCTASLPSPVFLSTATS